MVINSPGSPTLPEAPPVPFSPPPDIPLPERRQLEPILPQVEPNPFTKPDWAKPGEETPAKAFSA